MPGTQRQIERRPGGGGGAARVHDDELGPGVHTSAHPLIQDRVTLGHVRADDEKTVRVLEILVVPRRAVRAERSFVPGRRAGHAQARVAVDVVGAQETFGQLVGDVLGLGRELPGNVQGDGVRPVHVDDSPETIGDPLQGHVQRHPLERPTRAAALRVGETVGGMDGLVDRAALRTEAAEVGGMRLVAADACDPTVGHV